jgi:hypothetical protein
MHEDNTTNLFLGLSSILTGFEVVDLVATGMVDTYQAQFTKMLPSGEPAAILDAWSAIAAQGGDRTTQEAAVRAEMWCEPMLPALQSLTMMWYLGNWYADPTDPTDFGTLLSGQAYEQGLVWPAVGTKPLGARPTGFGSWALPPTAPVLPTEGVR